MISNSNSTDEKFYMVFDHVYFFNVTQNYDEINSNDNGVFEIYMINIEIIAKYSNFILNSISNR